MAAMMLFGSAAPVAAADAAESTPAALLPASLVATPSQAEGPFYPVELPADHDADLTQVDGADGLALGEVLLLDGLLVTTDGAPLADAIVEIWQTDAGGVYLHPDDPDVGSRDEAFQGYGEAVTDADGRWSFRTILPEVYGSRPRHIHAKVRMGDETLLTTQIYFSGGDIPEAGALPLTGDATDALLTSPVLVEATDGPRLQASHLLVVDTDRS